MGFLMLQRFSMDQETKNMQQETENGKIHEAYHGLFNTRKKRMKLKKLLDWEPQMGSKPRSVVLKVCVVQK